MTDVHARPPRNIAPILGVWLAGLFAASLVGRQEFSGVIPLAALTLALVWPLPYFALWGRTPPINHDTPLRTVMIGGLAVFGGISVFVSPSVYMSLGYWMLTLIGFYVAINFSLRLDAIEYTRALRIYVLLMLPMLIGLAWHEYAPGLRLGEVNGLLNPNALSLVTVSVAVVACIFRNRLLRYALIAPSVAIIYLAGSRASAIAVLAAWTIVLLVKQRGKGAVRILIAAAALVTTLALIVLATPALSAHLDQFFAISDAHRGLASGASGRVQTWKETWNLALHHPFTGVGLRAHETLLKTNSSAHNGYLATLAEIGFIGFTCVMALVITGILNLARRQDDPQWQDVQAVLLGLALGYLALAMFERYLINLGNPTSLLFLLAILFPRAVTRSATASKYRTEPERRAKLPRAAAARGVGRVLRRA